MRLDVLGDGPDGFVLALSRRNLLSLLARLERGVAGVIISENAYRDGAPIDGVTFAVRPEPDEVHYGDRSPGPMLPVTEAAIRWADLRRTPGENEDGPPDAG